MAIYIIGDVHGCLKPLLALLEEINFDQAIDQLWFTGDLVNRGPQSLETLRFIRDLGTGATTVLGNHDLSLLRFAHSDVAPASQQPQSLKPVLAAPDSADLLSWLQNQPLMHYDPEFNVIVVHAGVLPEWPLELALQLSREVEAALQGPNFRDLLTNMYGNTPSKWHPGLQGWQRLRFIVNCLTRMRFCQRDGELEFNCKGAEDTAKSGFIPWFNMPNRALQGTRIFFGHWAALKGKTGQKNVIALDTGCVWGGHLSAYRLEDGAMFHASMATC